MDLQCFPLQLTVLISATSQEAQTFLQFFHEVVGDGDQLIGRNREQIFQVGYLFQKVFRHKRHRPLTGRRSPLHVNGFQDGYTGRGAMLVYRPGGEVGIFQSEQCLGELPITSFSEMSISPRNLISCVFRESIGFLW